MTQDATRGRSRLDTGPVVVGIILITLGVLFLLEQTGSVDAGDLIRDWWPLGIVAIGLVQLVEHRRSPVGPLIVLAFGGILLLTQLDLVSADIWSYVWPILLVVVGLYILLRLPGRGAPAGVADEVVTASALFGSNELVVASQALRGGSASALFGEVVLDLRQATIDPAGATLAASAIFGSVDVIVPRGWRVEVSGTPIFGGLTSKVEPAAPGETPTLKVDSTAIFGGVTIKHDR